MIKKINIEKTSLLPLIERGITIIIIFLFTFPSFFHDYGIGLDTSYVWGLNWLFVNDYETLKQLVYPLGPLAFLKIPTVIGHNLLISFLFFSILKLGFIWLIFKLSEVMQNTGKYATVFIVFMVSYFVNIDFLIIGTTLILTLLYDKNKNIIYFIISVLIAFTGLFIKITIGVSALSVIGTFLLMNLYYSRNAVLLIKQLGILLCVGFITGMLIFGSVNTYFQFLIGAYQLSGGYGEALSLHPANNWVLLFPFLILIITFPFISKDKEVRMICILLLFSLFTMWKYGFTREDMPHYRALINFLIVFWGIIFIVSSSKKTLTLIFASVTILLLYANMHNIPMYRSIDKEIAGINNFREILNYRAFKQELLSISEKEVSENRLNPELRELIGESTVDAYPWEFSYIAANQFRWMPRKTLSIKLFDQKSDHAMYGEKSDFASPASSPEFIIFHLGNDGYGGKFGSIDQRNILNDEPQVIYNMLNNYTIVEKTDKFLLLKRDTVSRVEEIYWGDSQDYTFGEWIDIPFIENEIIRLNVSSTNTFLGKLNKIFYKETAYFIEYQFENEEVLTYRFIPQTAGGGLWCNPFIRNPLTHEMEPKVVKVRLRNANPQFVKNSIKTQIQHIKFKPVL